MIKGIEPTAIIAVAMFLVGGVFVLSAWNMKGMSEQIGARRKRVFTVAFTLLILYQLFGGGALLLKLYSITNLGFSILANFLVSFVYAIVITELLLVGPLIKMKNNIYPILVTCMILSFSITIYGLLLGIEDMGIFKVN